MKEEIWNNIVKRLSHTETAASKVELDLWLAESEENVKKYEESTILWNLSAKLQPQQTTDQLNFDNNLKSSKTRSTFIHYLSYGVAAACVAALFIFGLKFINHSPSNSVTEWTTQTAAPGKMLSVTLPDRSTVMLNSGSRIRYLKDFAKSDKRLIELIGEAFFDVVHKEEHPFVVETGKIKTVVYGTSFNVRAYKSESRIQIFVKSGKVGVLKDEAKSKPIFLTPNHSLTFDTLAKTFSNVTLLINAADDWKNGSLIFEQTPIMEVLATLTRRFNVKFDTTAYKHSSCTLTARFEQKNLEEILKTIQTVMNIKINQIDHTIYLKGGNACKEN